MASLFKNDKSKKWMKSRYNNDNSEIWMQVNLKQFNLIGDKTEIEMTIAAQRKIQNLNEKMKFWGTRKSKSFFSSYSEDQSK